MNVKGFYALENYISRMELLMYFPTDRVDFEYFERSLCKGGNYA